MKALILPVLLAVAVSACGKKAEEKAPQAAAPAATAAASAGKASATHTVAFTCEGDMAVTAIYGTNRDGHEELALVIQGDDFRLAPTPAPTGRRYASPDGAAAGKGIIWWEKADEVLLQQAPADKVNDPAAGVTARTCKVKTEPTAVPGMPPAPTGKPAPTDGQKVQR